MKGAQRPPYRSVVGAPIGMAAVHRRHLQRDLQHHARRGSHRPRLRRPWCLPPAARGPVRGFRSASRPAATAGCGTEPIPTPRAAAALRLRQSQRRNSTMSPANRFVPGPYFGYGLIWMEYSWSTPVSLVYVNFECRSCSGGRTYPYPGHLGQNARGPGPVRPPRAPLPPGPARRRGRH